MSKDFEPELSLDLFDDICECNGDCLCSDEDFDDHALDELDDLEDAYDDEEEEENNGN